MTMWSSSQRTCQAAQEPVVGCALPYADHAGFAGKAELRDLRTTSIPRGNGKRPPDLLRT